MINYLLGEQEKARSEKGFMAYKRRYNSLPGSEKDDCPSCER